MSNLIPSDNHIDSIIDLVIGDLFESVKEEKCILCLGPGLYSEPNESRLEQELAKYLKEDENYLGIRVYDDGWFHYLPGTTKIRAYKRIKNFYTLPNPYAEKILEKISEIPFHFIMNFVPDYKLRQIFEQKNFQYTFSSYRKKEPLNEELEVPSKETPLIFNFLGEVNQKNSLISSYSDFYEFLESIFEQKSMADQLLENIYDADYFLFLGLSFDKWYVHLFMHILRQHDENRGAEKFALHFPPDNKKLVNHCFEQYSITSIASNINKFVDKLHSFCEEKSFLRDPSNVNEITPTIDYDQIEKWFINNAFEEIINSLKFEIRKSGPPGESLHNLVLNFESQYNALKMNKIRGVLKIDELLAQEAGMRVKLQEILEQVASKFPNVSESND